MDLSSLGVATAGVWTRRSALRLLTAGQVDVLVREGAWQVLWPGVYADGGHVPTAEQRAVAAVLATGVEDQRAGAPRRAVASGRTAARHLGLALIDDDDPVTGSRGHRYDDVIADRDLPDKHYRGRVLRRQRRRLDRVDVGPLTGGTSCTTAARTLLDLATELDPAALVCAVDSALQSRVCGADDVRAVLARCSGVPGGPALGEALAVADGRAESPAESLARLLLLPVLPGLVPQHVLVGPGGRPLARFDLADDRARFAVECDGRAGHAGSAMVAKDRRRDWSTEQRGWRTERVTWGELRREPDAVVRRVLHAYRRHVERAA